jgi:hypothetical protein
VTTPKRTKPKVRLMQLYEYGLADEVLDTQYGHISRKAWLQKEKQRIERDKSRVAEIVYLSNAVGLFVNKVADYYITKNEEHKRPITFKEMEAAEVKIRLLALQLDQVTV